MQDNIPIQCSLSDKELRLRRKDFIEKFQRVLIGFDELENGFRYRLPAEDEVLQNLIEFINFERKCCPFLDFTLTVKSGDLSAELDVIGLSGSKEAIRELFNKNLSGVNYGA